jgi:hypothetical protein
MLVAERKKPKINLSLLPELREAFDKSAEKFGEKRKWIVSSAAVFLWLKLSEAERDALADRVHSADLNAEKREKLLSEVGIGDDDEFDKEQGVLSQPKASRASGHAKQGKSR